MNQAPMIDTHESAALWRIDGGQALQLTIGPGVRRLRVREGRLWFTTGAGATDAPADDVWLAPGEGLMLAEGSHVVAEGWPRASFELIVPPQACAASSPVRRALAWWTHGRH